MKRLLKHILQFDFAQRPSSGDAMRLCRWPFVNRVALRKTNKLDNGIEVGIGPREATPSTDHLEIEHIANYLTHANDQRHTNERFQYHRTLPNSSRVLQKCPRRRQAKLTRKSTSTQCMSKLLRTFLPRGIKYAQTRSTLPNRTTEY